ncbi:hypothetical protein DENSPDRAFT_781088 [Dentipellis sp. KUC8613]|nr:hypothetical protein DENSPDRAFT_781088 [Dentipellis sp. KUC8613]
MASTSSKSSSRFSSFKVFKFAGSSKPPAPPPKDPNYLYSGTNPSVLSFSNQSLSIDSFSQPPTPHSTQYPQSQYPPARCPSPAPSRATQSPGSSASLTPESAGFKKGIMKMASFGKRTFTQKSPRVGPLEDIQPVDVRDDESISLPWNFQVHRVRPLPRPRTDVRARHAAQSPR